MNTLIGIKKLLEENNVKYQEFHHKPVRTSQEADDVRPDYTMKQGAKALIIKARLNGDKKYFMLVLPGDKRIDSKRAKKMLKCKSFSFASEDEVVSITDGVLPGGVPPFGNLFKLPIYVDQTLSENDEIIFNAGDRSVSIAMKYSDYECVVDPNISDFVENA